MNTSDWNCDSNISQHYNDLPDLGHFSIKPGITYTFWGNGISIPISPGKSGWYVYNNTANALFHCTPILTQFEMTASYDGQTGWGFQ